MLKKQFDKTETIVLIGFGGHAKSVADIINLIHPFIQINFLAWEFSSGKPMQTIKHQSIITIGDNKKRKTIYESVGPKKLISIQSPLSYVSKKATIGRGCFVGNFCHIGPATIIGDNTIINTGAIIEHDTIIGKHCHIAPKATISGKTTVGNIVFVGAGATIIDGLSICSNVTIGAGATVIKNITEPGTYVGTPAKKTSP
ncbi:NeuD/PglB/VioB family sugar acetyltransferase [Candidatus Dependentiae bacterium]|nr:NeuD/PglB/VioB family sugar acetyltransferase [Candidatus Dependentiae bacterium]